MHAGRFIVFVAFALALDAPAQWVRWETSAGGNGHWYKAVPNTNGFNWEQASVAAQAEGGYLATITSQAENDFVFSLINDPQFFGTFNGSGPAIGGYQPDGSPEPAGGWSWVTGETWSYTNWAPNSPNNGGGESNENRLHFFGVGLGSTPASTWNDISANDSNLGGYVFERVGDPTFVSAAIYTAVEICWTTESNKVYQVQWTDQLSSSNWVNLTLQMPTTNTTQCILDSTRGQQQRFYRVLAF